MPQTVAVLDLGSNTFHILICSVDGDGVKEVYRKRHFVGLAEGGAKTLLPAAIDRAKKALAEFAESVKEYMVDNVRIIGTAALRMASNAHVVRDFINEQFGTDLEVIDGSREAELIYKGISLIADVDAGPHLIMDIGGGSTEFIIVEGGKPTWAQSFNIGVAILHELFHKTEPISDAGKKDLFNHLDTVLEPLVKALDGMEVDTLIGASGSFEVMVTMYGKELNNHAVNVCDIDNFVQLEETVINSDYEQRAQLEGMPASRVKLIVVAFLLIKYVLKHVSPRQMVVSPYALKEGLISEMTRS